MRTSKINNIKSICYQNGITLVELEKKTELSKITLSNYCTDILDLRKADFISVLKLSSALNCKPADLFQKPYNKCVEKWHYNKKEWGL